MNALAREEVGKYLNTHFVSAVQKVATFRVAGKNKQGGNVAAYFCTPEGHVLHAIAGPVDEETFLREVRWVNDTHDMALLQNHKTLGDKRFFFRKAHFERLRANGHGWQLAHIRLLYTMSPSIFGQTIDAYPKHRLLNNRDKMHLLLTMAPMMKIEQIYQTVFEKILNEKISTRPVQVAGK